ncbi:hypothetical protein PsorP6_001014 [Peronosclerospora sorghi]|uniref:Uncharacterized protein n=1 Tax=Peronosclerospora sorghi TaxID=230839 RepID=A0ACC0WWU3_9STRA|nr:hypothetical protein PsorP6_001014 [Peronosclerospora sorghi]
MWPSKAVSSSSIEPQADRTVHKKIDGRFRPFSTAKRHNRRRPKQEVDVLRAKVLELEKELSNLRCGNVSSAVISRKASQIHVSWRDVLELEKQRIAASLTENQTLRNQLWSQLEVAYNFEAGMLQHQIETLILESIADIPRPLALSCTAIFTHLNRSLQTQLREVGTIFTTHGLSSVLRELHGGVEFQREPNGLSFRHEQTRLVPFSWCALHQAVWNSLHNGSVVHDTKAQLIEKDHSNLILWDAFELLQAHQITVTKYIACQRYLETDRVVFVWSSYVLIDGDVSVRLHERGWSMAANFELHQDVTYGTDRSNTFMRSCISRVAMELVPEVCAFTSEQERQRRGSKLANLIVNTYRHNCEQVLEVVNKRLVREDSDKV